MVRFVAALIRLAATALFTATAADQLLRRRRGDAPPEPLRMLVVIDAPIERVWTIASDIERQPVWMQDMRRVALLTDPPVDVGTRGLATVRMLGIEVTDPVTITEWQPPTRLAIRHEGRWAGGGVITLESGIDGTTTVVRWAETLRAPILPDLASVLQAPVFRAVFQADLVRLKRLVETGSPEGPESPLVRLLTA
jgi:uncharacterized membrane protein